MEYIFTIDGLPEAAACFISAIGSDRVFDFKGSMGAGKTTLISEVCRQLGVADDIGSPTFSIVNEYRSADGAPIYHFDFYRIDSPQEALDLGAEDYFYSGSLCFMEWAEKIEGLLPEETRTVEITELPDGRRKLTF